MQHDGGAAGTHLAASQPAASATATGCRGAALGARVGHGNFGFHVLGIGRDALDEGAVGVDAGGAEALARAELLEVAGEEAAHLDDGRAVLGKRRHRERLMMESLLAAFTAMEIGLWDRH